MYLFSHNQIKHVCIKGFCGVFSPQESDGKCIFPEDVEADSTSMQRIVVYDNNTSCLWEKGIFL